MKASGLAGSALFFPTVGMIAAIIMAVISGKAVLQIGGESIKEGVVVCSFFWFMAGLCVGALVYPLSILLVGNKQNKSARKAADDK